MEINIRNDVRNRLIEVARRRGTITYGEIMGEFRISRGHRIPRFGIGYILGQISNYENRCGRPLLSVIVVRANSRTKLCPQGHPGGGFFGVEGIPSRLRRRAENHQNATLSREEQEYVRQQQERVWNYWERT